MSAVQLSWVDGGHATVMQSDGERVVLSSSRSAPPGAPLTASSTLESVTLVRIKVQECRKNTDGSFMIRGRWLDLSRATRQELAASVPSL